MVVTVVVAVVFLFLVVMDMVLHVDLETRSGPKFPLQETPDLNYSQ